MRELLRQFVTYASKATYVFVLVILTVVISGAILNNIESSYDDTFSVEGTAKREVKPDTINLNVGVITEGTDIIKMQDAGNQKINDTVTELKEMGISEDKIQTSQFSLTPTYDYTGNTSKIIGYTLNIELAVEVAATEEGNAAGDVIQVATDNGLNEVRSLQYSVSNRDELLDELKLEAIEDAKSKKDEVADAAGLRLGKLKTISDYGSYYPMSYRSDDLMLAEASAGAEDADVKIEVQTGTTELSITVTLIYEIK
jgi:hypothetical protein